MSAVLTSPSLPTMLNLKDLESYIQSEIQKGIEKALPAAIEKTLSSKKYVSIEEYEDLKAGYGDIVELLANANKHITQLENALFSTDSEGELVRDETNKPVISPNLTKAHEKPTEEEKSEPEITARTTLELKAVSLVCKLRIKPRSRTGEVFMDNSELNNFLTKELPEELRSDDSNLRRVKKRVIEKAKSLFPDSILINKSKYGRHETRIVLKESYLCKGTVQ